MKKILTISLLVLFSIQLMAQKSSELPKKKKPLPETLFNIDLNFMGYLYAITNSGESSSLAQLASNKFTDFLYRANDVPRVKAMIGSKNTGIIIGYQSCRMGSQSYLKNVYSNTNMTTDSAIYFYSNPAYNPYKNKGFSIRLGYQKALISGLYASVSGDLTRIKANVEHKFYNNNFSIYEFEKDRIIWGMRLNAGLGYTLSIGKAKKFYLNNEIVYSFIDKSKSNLLKLNLNFAFGFRIGTPSKTTYDGIKEVNTVPLKR